MSNHIGNANKMVDTPRTDEFIAESCALPPVPIRLWPDFARQLERELNAANQRIKRLEENIESLKVWGNELNCEVYVPYPNCSCHISPPCNDCLEYSNIREIKAGWKAAKEAKP